MYSFPAQRKRREKLMKKMGDGLIYIRAKDEIIRNGDVPVKYRQASDFLYLTGIEEINYHLLLDPKTNQGHLFIPDIDPLYLVWVGKMYNTKEAKKLYGAKKVHFYSDFEKVLKTLGRKYKKIYVMPERRPFMKKMAPKHTIDTKHLKKTLHYMRAFKDAEEISLMKFAAKVNHKAFLTAMKTVKAGMYEYQISALLDKVYRDEGTKNNAFLTIAAVGRHPAILHYIDYSGRAKPGDLCLIDAGCERHGYASDITRTFPVNKTFSKKQRDIYELVLDIQKQCIKASKPGAYSQNIHELAAKMTIQGLKDLGIFKKIDLEELYAQDAHRLFFPHGIGHLLGVDVHDVGADVVKRTLKPHKHMRSSVDLQPNMVFTIEPGIYFLDVYFKSKKERKKYQKILNWSKADQYFHVGGVRIEDDIIITKTGNINLTKPLPKEVRDIERLRK